MVKNEKVIGNFIWRLFERFGAQGVTLIVSIVLARLLDPAVYGTVALVTVLTTLLQVFIDSGLGTALIQKKDADDLDFSSVFYFNMVMCIALYVGLFFAAPYIAKFYNLPELIAIVRVLGLTLVISGVKNIQQAYVSRHMLFKKFFFATLGGTIGAAVAGIIMAYLGFGVWALVGQYLFNATIDTLVLWITVKWRPKMMFSFERLKVLFGFGIKLLGVALLTTIYEDIRQILIGKLYTTSDLAFYNKAKQFPALFNSNINASIDSILLPVMSKEQDDITAVKAITKRSIKTSTYIMTPFLIGLAMCGDTFVELILTDKWLPCVPYMRIFCATFILTPMLTANQNAFKALGRMDLYLKTSVVSRIIGVIILIATLPYGVMVMSYGLFLTNVIFQIVCTFPNGKLIKYSYLEQMKDVISNIILSIIMGIVVYVIGLIELNVAVVLLLQIVLGIIVYLVGSILLKNESFNYVLNVFTRFKKRKLNK